MKKGLLISLSIFVLIILVGGIFVFRTSKEAQQAFNPSQFNWQANGKDGTYIVKMKSANVTAHEKGTVVSDANCDPDNEGLSHCNVEIVLQNGKQIEFVMTHNMMNYPCLNLKSTIELSPYGNGYAKVKI